MTIAGITTKDKNDTETLSQKKVTVSRPNPMRISATKNNQTPVFAIPFRANVQAIGRHTTSPLSHAAALGTSTKVTCGIKSVHRPNRVGERIQRSEPFHSPLSAALRHNAEVIQAVETLKKNSNGYHVAKSWMR